MFYWAVQLSKMWAHFHMYRLYIIKVMNRRDSVMHVWTHCYQIELEFPALKHAHAHAHTHPHVRMPLYTSAPMAVSVAVLAALSAHSLTAELFVLALIYFKLVFTALAAYIRDKWLKGVCPATLNPPKKWPLLSLMASVANFFPLCAPLEVA